MQRPPFAPPTAAPERPTLQLSGPKLRAALERLIAGAESAGGIERWVTGLKFKEAVFGQALAPAVRRDAGALDEETFLGLCALMPTVRRRVAPWLAEVGFESVRALVARLLDDAPDAQDAGARIAAFCARFPAGRDCRYARDLAAELLHWTALERYPLMARWVWDRAAGTGVVREIWHDDSAPALDQLSDGTGTFLVLREELAQYLTDNGFFRDVPYYVDLLCAQVYAGYIVEQGGAYLRTDFASEHDPMQYVRRMLGLDGIDLESGVTRLKRAGGGAFALPAPAHAH